MNKTLRYMSVLLAAALALGCGKSGMETPPEQEEDFILEVSDITQTSCSFSVTPADKDMTYVVMLVEKSDFDSFENEYEYQDNDLEWFSQKAEEEGKTLSEWLEGFLHKGDFEASENGLVPGSDYYLYAYGLSVGGYFDTGVTKVEFSTPAIQMKDISFEIEVSEIGLTKAKVSVTASDEDALFFFNVFSKEEYQEWGGNEEAFSRHAGALVDYYVQLGQTTDAMVENLGSIGSAELVFDGLTDGTEYIAYAIGIDEMFYVNSKAGMTEFTTKKAVTSSNTFTVDIQETTFCSVRGTVTPSNDDPFICTIMTTSQLEGFGDDTDAMYEIASSYIKWDILDDILYEGETVNLESISYLEPETEYSVVCFGWDEAPTTALSKTPFKTKAAGGNPKGQEITFSITSVMHNKAIVEITPKLGLHYFYDCMPAALLEEYKASEGSEDEAICRFLDERIDYGAEYFSCTRAEYLDELGAAIGKQKWTFTGLEEDTDYIIVAATVNTKTGEIVIREPFRSEVFHTTILIESDAAITFKIDKYYDGTELAELDPAQFGKCKGMVMVPYEVIPNEDAAHWRTTFAYGEFASWAERDDILTELDYKNDKDKRQGYAVVHYDQVVSFLGIAEDADGYTGPFTIHEFQAEKGGASPPEEFLESLK